MNTKQRERIESAGWRTGSATDFLELTPAESAFVEMKLALADHLHALRIEHEWTQSQVATRLHSSQSRVAKMEAADRSVSLDLLVRSLLALGASAADVAGAIARRAA